MKNEHCTKSMVSLCANEIFLISFQKLNILRTKVKKKLIFHCGPETHTAEMFHYELIPSHFIFTIVQYTVVNCVYFAILKRK